MDDDLGQEKEKDDRLRGHGDAARCSKQSSKRTYTKKRRFYGKPGAGTGTAKVAKRVAVSLKKVKKIRKSSSSYSQGYRLMDMAVLHDIISCLGCPECHECDSLYLEEDPVRKKGLASMIVIACDCGYKKETYTSKTVKKSMCNVVSGNRQGLNPYDINIRAVYGMRSVGLDHSGLDKFCGMLNMPKPMTIKNFNNISSNLRDAAKVVAEKTMVDAIDELRTDRSEPIIDIGVSVDGTWQRRGFSSLNGVVAALSIDNGKVVDIEPMSRYCRECAIHTSRLQDDEVALAEWKVTHKDKCKLTHEGSAPSMEPVGAERIFARSMEKNGARYLGFYGDGDSKAFMLVEFIYGGDKIVIKYECIGHYQKRVGNRLRKLKKRVSGLKDLTEAVMDILQNYFGIALRSNVTTVEEMSEALLGSFFHVASGKRNLHTYCQKGSTSWCQFQRDVANGTNLHKAGSGLNDNTISHVKPIYQSLIKPEELKKLLHGKTQNQNESFNAMIWERAPKYRYCAFDKLEFAVYDAVANFNIGRQASLDIFKMLNIDPGYYMLCACAAMNIKRRRSAMNHSTAEWRKRRKIIRAEKKRKTDKNKKKEGKTYKAGEF